MDHIQKRIANTVEAYKLAFPQEYKIVAEGNAAFKQTIKDDKFATTGNSSHIARQLHIIPERLYTALIQELSSNELEYFKSTDGARWFASKYREFRIPDKI